MVLPQHLTRLPVYDLQILRGLYAADILAALPLRADLEAPVGRHSLSLHLGNRGIAHQRLVFVELLRSAGLGPTARQQQQQAQHSREEAR